MGKANAYELFVKDVFRRKRDAGENVVFRSLFATLDSEWRNMPEEVKQRYKDKAKNINSGRISTGKQNTSLRPAQNATYPPQTIATQAEAHNPPPPRSAHNYADQKEPKVKIEITVSKETKPILKQEERGCKRDHEIIDDCKSKSRNDQQLQVWEEPGPDIKKAKLGLPNWNNIKKSNQPESVRYSDYYLLELKNSCESIIKTRVSKLMTMPMYSYSANVLCKYEEEGKSKFIPLEISICSYSVRSGRIEAPYHVLINPGDIPLKCYNASRDHSELTHKITVGRGNYPPEARSDYKNIYKEMLNYTKAGERTLLISDTHDLTQAKGTIEWLYEKALKENPTVSLAKPSMWTLLPMVDYVVAMYNHVHMKMLRHDSPMFVLPYYLRMQLECSLLDYNSALMCSYHSKEDRQTKWCTLSCAQRVFLVIEPTLEGIQRNYDKAVSQLTTH